MDKAAKTPDAPLSERLMKKLEHDTQNSPVRQLDEEERGIYAQAVLTAVQRVPAFRDAIALMRPYLNVTFETAATDEYSRVGFGYWFFHIIDRDQRATVLLHECMHVLNNHFPRFRQLGSKHAKLNNLAGDMEINTVLQKVPFTDLSVGILPDRDPFSYEPMKSMEYYFEKLKEDQEDEDQDSGDGEGSEGEDDGEGEGSSDSSGQGNGQPGNGQPGEGKGKSKGKPSGTGSPCDQVTDEDIAAADEAGVDRASDVEQTIAKQNTAVRIREDQGKNRSRGLGAGDEFFDAMLAILSPPKVDWRNILRSVISSSMDAISRGRSDYSYRRVSRRLQSDKFIFPGMVKYDPKVMLGIDTSGSMGNADYEKSLTEIEGIVKNVARGKDAFSMFSVDTQVGAIKPVTSTRHLKLHGGGGTQMAVAFRFVSALPASQRPNLFVLSTDGYIDWDDVERELVTSQRLYKSVILVTTEGGFNSAPERARKLASIIDISAEDSR